jgi:nickel-dependent lactate racemase
MGSQKVKKAKMHINAHRGDNEIELGFPESWDITECRMAGHDKPSLPEDEMRSALQSPIGTPRLSEMAKGAKKVCILFDDIAKPTPADRIIPFVLEELHAGGVTDDQIRFVSAPGTHMPMTYREFLAKLGREIVEKYPVYNHSVWENVVDVGKTSRGTPVKVNREFASCETSSGWTSRRRRAWQVCTSRWTWC